MMSLSDLNIFSVPGIGIALDAPVRPNKRKTPNIKDYSAKSGSKPGTQTGHSGKLLRVINKAPEVLVKVSGSGKTLGQVHAHMTYITRNGKLEAEDERGDRVAGKEEVDELFAQWGFDTQDGERKRAKTVNMVLSMQEGTNPNAVLWAARKFAQDKFAANHQFLLVLHTDTPHPHVHLSVKAQGYDLTWVKRSKADLQEWREMFAERLREQGIEAEATPRRARGVKKKAKTQPLYHLTYGRNADGSAKSKSSYVVKEKVDQAIREIQGGSIERMPWDEALKKSGSRIQEAYKAIEAKLREGNEPESIGAANKLRAFVAEFPGRRTEAQDLRERLSGLAQEQQKRVGGGGQESIKDKDQAVIEKPQDKGRVK